MISLVVHTSDDPPVVKALVTIGKSLANHWLPTVPSLAINHQHHHLYTSNHWLKDGSAVLHQPPLGALSTIMPSSPSYSHGYIC